MRHAPRLSSLALLICLLAGTSCGDDGSPLGPVDRIVLDEEVTPPLLPGGTALLTAAALDAGDNLIPGSPTVWSTSEASIATVGTPSTDALGRSRVTLSAHAEGTVTVTAKVARSAGDTVSQTMSVQVSRSQIVGSNTPLNTPSLCCGHHLIASETILDEAMTVTHLGIVVGAGGANARLMLYSDNGRVPSTLLAQTAEFTLVDGVNEVALPTPLQIGAGRYWVATNFSADVQVYFGTDAARAYAYPTAGANFTDPPPTTWPEPTIYSGYRMAYYVKGGVP